MTNIHEGLDLDHNKRLREVHSDLKKRYNDAKQIANDCRSKIIFAERDAEEAEQAMKFFENEIALLKLRHPNARWVD